MSIGEKLGLKRPDRQVEPEKLVFARSGRGIAHWGDINVTLDDLRSNPETRGAMDAIENGPNATLYRVLIDSIKESGVPDEDGEWLVVGASALFFGNLHTDAEIEGMINFGGPIEWHEATSMDIVHLPEKRRPAYLLIRERVREIVDGDFSLPLNEKDLGRNAELQIARVGKQILDGTLQRKARMMDVNQDRGEAVGRKMVEAIKQVQEVFVPGIDQRVVVT